MRTYYYTPTVYVYAAVVGKDGAMTYYDLTEDVVSCTVNRNTDNASSANVTLLNRGWKYNDVFTPFDMIAVFASKGSDKIRLFTGYMTTVTRFTLYEQNFTIEAKDLIYRLSQLYFDPHIMATTNLMSDEDSRLEGWNDASQLWKLLNVIGGVPENQIKISEMPTAAMNWARELYMAQKADYEQSEQIAKEMFESIMNSSVTISASGAFVGVDGGKNVSGGALSTGAAGSSKNLAPKQKRLVDEAYVRPYRGYGLCAAWVWNVFNDAGFGGPSWPTARDYYNKYCNYTDRSQLLAGMIIAVPTSGATGNSAGHIGIYVGDNTVRHNADKLKDSTLDAFIDCYTAHGTYGVGWGWYDGNDLTR